MKFNDFKYNHFLEQCNIIFLIIVFNLSIANNNSTVNEVRTYF